MNELEIPPTWATAAVQDLFDIVGGGTPSTTVAEYWTGSIPWITSADIDESHHVTPRKFVSEEGIHNSATNKVPPGSIIVVTRVGLGKVGTAPTELCFSQDSQALLFNKALLDPRYVLLFMGQAVAVFKHISRGTTISGVTKKQLATLQFLLPPLSEQERIVAEIEKQFTRLDAAVSALKRVQANLKRYRAAVLKAACEGRLVPTEAELARKEGRSYETGEQLLARILKERRAKWGADQLAKMHAAGKPPKSDDWKKKYKDPEPSDTDNLPSLPVGWTWSNLDQLKLFSIYGPRFSSDDYSESGTIVLRTTDISESGKVDLGSAPRLELGAKDVAKYQLIAGDLVFTRTGATIGKTAIFDDEVQAIPGAYLIHFRLATETATAWYIYRFFQSTSGQSRLLAGRLGIGQPNLNAPTIEAIPIPLPPVPEQQRILAAIDAQLTVVEKEMGQVSESWRKGDRLRQSILKRAFEGKLVPQDPNDEPASVLLERIRAERGTKVNGVPGQKRKARRSLMAALQRSELEA